MDLEPSTFGDEKDFDDNKTMVPSTNDEDRSFATGQTSCFTRKPTNDKHVAFADTDDFSDFKSHRTLKPPEPPQPEDYMTVQKITMNFQIKHRPEHEHQKKRITKLNQSHRTQRPHPENTKA